MNTIINLYDPEASGIVEFGLLDSPFGKCLAAFNCQGMCAFEFIVDVREAVGRLRAGWADTWVNHNEVFDNMNFFHFLSDSLKPLPLCLKGTPFQIEVWKTLLRIPFGQTVSHSEVARMMGKPESAGAVASAIAANSLALVVPCHRVVSSDGDPGDYRWGRERKVSLLDWERGRETANLLRTMPASNRIRHNMAAKGTTRWENTDLSV